MTDAPGQFLLPVDESAPPERLRWPMLLAAGAAVVLIHLALVTVFTPLAPDTGERKAGTGFAASFISSQAMMQEPLFQKMVDTYDPVSFLHPPEEVGFSFFRFAQDDFSLGAPSEPVLPPQKLAELNPPPPFEPGPVVRPLVRDVPDVDDALRAEAVPVSELCPYCVADSRPNVKFPAFPLDAQTERILRRTPPSRPSVFELRQTTDVISDPDEDDRLPGESGPSCEAVLTESCGVAELDLAARAWLDTLLNSQDAPPSLRRGDRCRVVWSAKAIGKEPSAR